VSPGFASRHARALLVLAGVAGASASAWAGWAISDHMEADNDFCVSCHLDAPSGAQRPLHAAKGLDFDNAAATSLVAAHRAAREDFRCIDCHGGASFLNKLRVKSVAARDAVSYALGSFGEPETMQHPLWDEDCAQCHASYSPERDDAFHAISVHNTDLPYTCVDCHRSHATGNDATLDFLDPQVVLPTCRHCHEEF